MTLPQKLNENYQKQMKNTPTGYQDTFRIFMWLSVLSTLLTYLPVLNNNFVNWDDPVIIQQNSHIRSLDLSSLLWLFTNFQQGFYMPFTWVSLSFDYKLGGLDPWVYHLHNLLLHAFNTALIFMLGYRILGLASKSNSSQDNAETHWRIIIPSFLASLLFGLHPIHVETVAWATERKDLLCGLFYLLSLLFYLNYATRHGKNYGRLVVCFGFFTLSFLSKPMAFTLPFILVLLDVWPLDRFTTHKLGILFEKIPFFLTAFAFGWLSVLAESKVNAVASLSQIPLGFRVTNSFHSLAFYLSKMAFPSDLTVLYAFHLKRTLSFEYLLSALAVILFSIFCYYKRKKYPEIMAAWAAYVLMLGPVLGIIQVGGQAAADRYTYLPSFGPFLLASFLLTNLLKKRPLILFLISLGLASCLSFISVKQIAIWRNSISLWENAIKVDPRNSASAFACLGDAYRLAGREPEAVQALDFALKIDPRLSYSLNSKGKLLMDRGSVEEAISEFKSSAASAPEDGWAHCHLDVLYSGQGKNDLALTERTAALASNPGEAWAHFDDGTVYEEYNLNDPALAQLQEAIRLNPRFAEAFNQLGRILGRQKRQEESIEAFQKSVSLEPNNVDYKLNLANAWLHAGKPREAMVLYKKLSNQ